MADPNWRGNPAFVRQPVPKREQQDRENLRRARKHVRRARTLRVINKGRPVGGAAALRADTSDVPHLPVLRSKCPEARPCPFVSCKFNLYLDVSAVGTIKLNFPDLEPDEMGCSCVLDVADRGGDTLEQVGALMNMTRERVRQLEASALEKIRGAWLDREGELR